MIQKNSDTGMASDWFLSAGVAGNEVAGAADAKPAMTREEVVAAKAEIERCVEKGERFFVHENLDSTVRSELNEYAEAVGLSTRNIKEISDRQQQSYAAVEALASVNQTAAEVKRPEPVFDIGPAEITDPAHFARNTDWEESKGVSKMGNRPDPNSSVVPIRGADSVETSRVVGNRRGENSMAAPDAIEQLVKSEEKSGREKIRSANEERKSEILFDKTNWEAQAVSGMSEAELPRAGVLRTESPLPQNHSETSKYENSISQEGREGAPEQTMGETISERNAQKRADIQRSKKNDKEWNQPKSSVPTKVSDLFYEDLERRLKEK